MVFLFIYNFSPYIIIISAGFDAHKIDPIDFTSKTNVLEHRLDFTLLGAPASEFRCVSFGAICGHRSLAGAC